MNTHYVLTVLTDDRPGIVETIANTINRHGGNWLESRMAHFAGKFAGILHLSVAQTESEALERDLTALSQRGIHVVFEAGKLATDTSVKQKEIHFSIVGNDRTGIVKEVTQAFAVRQINMEELNSEITSAPHVGTPLFEAEGIIRVPTDTDMADLETTLNTISNELAVDIQLDESLD